MLRFLIGIFLGTYDKLPPGERPENPLIKRASGVKSYLSDAEGLGEKLQEKDRELLEAKKNNAMQTQSIRDNKVKVSFGPNS